MNLLIYLPVREKAGYFTANPNARYLLLQVHSGICYNNGSSIHDPEPDQHRISLFYRAASLKWGRGNR
ncbi:hypothetical protein, partial [Bacteroides thetaiotaomicron]|uniref:hypothetical protein n=1 Tax=Bacteroides thetaiotaomicron TaxID=818 RepID=UPI000321FD99